MLIPRMAPPGRPSRHFQRRARTRSTPTPGNPSRFMSPESSMSRNMRGRGLPGCGSGVTVPASTNPHPIAANAPGAWASLSRPAGQSNRVREPQSESSDRKAWVADCERPLQKLGSKLSGNALAQMKGLECPAVRSLRIDQAKQRPNDAVRVLMPCLQELSWYPTKQDPCRTAACSTP